MLNIKQMLKKYILKFINIIIKLLNNLINYLNKNSKNDRTVKIIHKEFNPNGHFMSFVIVNNNLFSRTNVLREIFYTLKNNEDFINFGKYKVIIVSAIVEDLETSFHHNVYIDNNTTFEDYFDKVKDYIETTYGEYGYNIDIIPTFKIRVFNMDLIKNKNIKITKNVITNTTQLTKKVNINRNYSTTSYNSNTNKVIKPKSYQDIFIGMENKFMTMDIETINTNNNIQTPVTITLCNEDTAKNKLLFSPKINNDSRLIYNINDKTL
jgi:hypothetical protein